MNNEIDVPKEITDAPFKDWEHPSLRFDIKENDNVTKHMIFFKTDKKQSFSEQTSPKKMLLDALIDIQKLPKITNQNDQNTQTTFDQFITRISDLIPHLIHHTKKETNTIKLDMRSETVNIEILHRLFKVASKGKRKTMLNKSLL